MFKRLLCLACTVVLLAAMVGGVSVRADSIQPMLAVKSHRPAPLVSAMFLVLAGMGISMLFDKKE